MAAQVGAGFLQGLAPAWLSPSQECAGNCSEPQPVPGPPDSGVHAGVQGRSLEPAHGPVSLDSIQNM